MEYFLQVSIPYITFINTHVYEQVSACESTCIHVYTYVQVSACECVINIKYKESELHERGTQ